MRKPHRFNAATVVTILNGDPRDTNWTSRRNAEAMVHRGRAEWATEAKLAILLCATITLQRMADQLTKDAEFDAAIAAGRGNVSWRWHKGMSGCAAVMQADAVAR